MNHVGISLGADCLSAIWAVTHQIRSTKENNYNTCPFDLMFSNYNGIIQCLIDDFKYFTDPAVLTYTADCIVNTHYNFGFNHETPYHADLYIKEKWAEGPNHFINNNYAHFIERYNQRIDNFRSYLSDTRNFITFILFPNGCAINDCKDLKDVLAIKYPLLQYKILIIEGPVPHDLSKTKLLYSIG
jgi:hypothetical protein